MCERNGGYLVSFTRSPSGIRNSALFFGADRTVYVEGTGEDQKFWQSVFTVFYSGPLRFHFKSVGPRTAVLPYVEGIAKNTISNSIAIIDSDYEGLRFSKFIIPNIIYSFGYSFENDLFTFKQAVKLLSQLSGGASISKCKNIINRLNLASDELSKLAVLDFVAQFNDQYFLIKNGNTCKLDIKNNATSVICKKSIAAAKKNFIARGVLLKSRPSKALRNSIVESPKYRWVYGHLWRAAFTKCVADELRKNFSVSINPDGITNLAIDNVRASRGRVFTKRQIAEYKTLMNSVY